MCVRPRPLVAGVSSWNQKCGPAAQRVEQVLVADALPAEQALEERAHVLSLALRNRDADDRELRRV